MHRRVRTWHTRAARGFYSRPMRPFVLHLAILTPLILASEPRRAGALYLFLLPWLLPVFMLTGLPFMFAMFRAFQVDLPTRRNHALEHATIRELEAAKRVRLGGRASATGFRVVGHVSIDDVRSAFDRVRQRVREGASLRHVTPRCGSNVVSSIGVGLLLLLGASAWSIAFQPPWQLRAVALLLIVGAFVAMRQRLGNALQRHFFMAVDFEDVSLRDVRHARGELFDRGPAIFVETIVRPRRRPSTRVAAARDRPTSPGESPRS